MKLLVVDGYALPIAGPEMDGADFYDLDISKLELFLSVAKAKEPQLFHVKSKTFLSVKPDVVAALYAAAQDHPSMRHAVAMAAEFEAAAQSENIAKARAIMDETPSVFELPPEAVVSVDPTPVVEKPRGRGAK